MADADLPFRGILVAEGEHVETVAFATQAELDAYSDGAAAASDCYGAGNCGVWSLADLPALDDALPAEQRIAELVRQHLRGPTVVPGCSPVDAETLTCASLVETAALRWPDNPLIQAVLRSLAAELRERLSGARRTNADG